MRNHFFDIQSILSLNFQVAGKEAIKESVQVPDLPSFIMDQIIFGKEEGFRWEV
jgi:hypothetical protein